MTIQCMFCKGEYKLQTVNRIMTVIGIHEINLTGIDIYSCDGCGREIYPERTVKEIDRIHQEYSSPVLK